MTASTLGLLVGGLLPAVAFGVSGVFVKASNQNGIGVGIYTMLTGLAVAVCGLILFLLLPDRTVSLKSGTHAFLAGFTWAIGAAGIALAVSKFGAPLSKLIPLYNINTLIGILLVLWIFAEWKEVKLAQLLLGSALIIVGSVVVSRA